MTEHRCEECLGETDEHGQCPEHPYARLIPIEASEAEDFRAAVSSIHQQRASVASVALVCAIAAAFVHGSQVFELGAITIPVAAALFFPPAAMLAAGRHLRTGHPGTRPVWRQAALMFLGWYLLVAGFDALSSLALQQPIRSDGIEQALRLRQIVSTVSLSLFALLPLSWLLGLGVWGHGWWVARQEAAAAAPPLQPQESERDQARKRAAQAASRKART